MLKNLKLGLKMGIGFGIVILLVLAIGGLAVLNMLQIQKQSESLEQEYVPEVDLANNIERNSLQVMYNMRGYSLNFNRDFYELGQEYMAALNDYLGQAEQLAVDYPGLVQLKEDVKVAQNNVALYDSLARETDATIQEIAAQRKILDESAGEYIKQADAFLESQQAAFQDDLAANAGTAALSERMQKIYLMNGAIDLANNARILTFKAQADFDYALIGEALDELDKIPAVAAELNKITKLQINIDQLTTIAETRGKYYAALEASYAAYQTLQDLNGKRNDAADKVLESAQDTAAAGIENTKKIAAEAVAKVSSSVVIIAIGLAIAVLLAIIIAVFLTISIVRALQKGVDFAKEIALGDLQTVLDVKQRDEVGILADALREMQKSLQYKADKIEQIANKDLTIDIEKASEKDGLGASLILMKDSLHELLSQVNDAVDQVASGSDQVSQASQNLSQGATEQASSLEEISSSITEVNSQSKQNADNATEANGLAKQATIDAEGGNEQMKELVEAMNRINASSDEINKVVKVIDDIAFQINLLALNANVEAARAGKYGKGFAVVAEEVRNLAVRAAEAVKETSSMVEDSISNIKEGNDLVDRTATQLDSIVTGSSKVAEFLGEIASASKEQAQAIDQITEGLDQIDQVTQGNTASAEESASAAEELAGQAQQLKAMIETFKLDEQEGRKVYLEDKRSQKPRTAAPMRPQTKPPAQSREQTAINPVGPSEVINLDDDDFDSF
jgi:methyl-accepting chemotaxis protein